VTELQQSRYDQLMRRVGDLKGPGSKVNDVLQELFPMVDVENVPTELLILGGTRIGFGSVRLLANVGDVPKSQLFNPADSGFIVTITDITHTIATVVTEMRFAFAAAGVADEVGQETFRDTRGGLASTPVAQVRSEISLGGIPGIWQVSNLPNVPFPQRNNKGLAVLGPGTGLTCAPNTTNVTTVVAWKWRERVAEPSELNF